MAYENDYLELLNVEDCWNNEITPGKCDNNTTKVSTYLTPQPTVCLVTGWVRKSARTAEITKPTTL